MKRQVNIIWNIGIYKGDIRRVDFDVADRMIANGTALPVDAEPRLHAAEHKQGGDRGRRGTGRSNRAGKAPTVTKSYREAHLARSKG